MHEFNLPDMSCGHCRAAVTEAIKALDDKAGVQVDLTRKTVSIDSALSDVQLAAALTDAGYPPA